MDFTSHWTDLKKYFKPEMNKRTGGDIIQCGSRSNSQEKHELVLTEAFLPCPVFP